MKHVFLLIGCLAVYACTVAKPIVPANNDHSINSEETAVSTQGTTMEMGPLWVRIDEPLDGATILLQTVIVKGEASPETVLTINDNIIYVQDGPFEVSIPLLVGDNLLEIVASDIQGNEIALYLMVTRE